MRLSWLRSMVCVSSTMACAGCLAFAQDIPLQPDPVVTLQVHARAVILDVVVTDKDGHPAQDLTAKDFNIIEDGVSQRIASFEEIKPPSAEERAALAGAKLPPNTFSNADKVMAGGAIGTYTVLLLDALNTRPEYQSYGYKQMKKWVDSATLTGPVAIFSLDTSLHLVQGFTNDIEVLRNAVHNYQGVVLTPIPQGQAGYVAQQMRLGGLTGAIAEISQYLSKFPGRKNLIWFTGSIPVNRREDGTYVSSPIRDPETFSYDFKSSTDVLTLGRISLYPVDVEGLKTDPDFNAANGNTSAIGRNESSLRSTVGAVRAEYGHGNDIGIREGTKHIDMQDAAYATGGKAYYDTNDISHAIAEVVESGSHYYTLTYYPTNKNWDGKYRKLKVDLDAKDDHLEYRRGYFALIETTKAKKPPPGGSANTLNMRRQITSQSPEGFWHTMHLGAIDPGTIVFRVHAAPEQAIEKLEKNQPLPQDNFLEPKFRDKPFRQMDVDFVVDGKQLQIAPSADGLLQGKLEFALVVLDDKGTLVNIFDATVDMDMKPATYEYLLKNGAQFPARIAVPVKGNYFIRAGVHDVSSAKAGALEMNISEIKTDGGK